MTEPAEAETIVAVAVTEAEAEYTDVMSDDNGTGTVLYSTACTPGQDQALTTRTRQSTHPFAADGMQQLARSSNALRVAVDLTWR